MCRPWRSAANSRSSRSSQVLMPGCWTQRHKFRVPSMFVPGKDLCLTEPSCDKLMGSAPCTPLPPWGGRGSECSRSSGFVFRRSRFWGMCKSEVRRGGCFAKRQKGPESCCSENGALLTHLLRNPWCRACQSAERANSRIRLKSTKVVLAEICWTSENGITTGTAACEVRG